MVQLDNVGLYKLNTEWYVLVTNYHGLTKFMSDKDQTRNHSTANNFISPNTVAQKAQRRVWDHRNIANWDFIHRVTALKKHQHRKSPRPPPPQNILKTRKMQLSDILSASVKWCVCKNGVGENGEELKFFLMLCKKMSIFEYGIHFTY